MVGDPFKNTVYEPDFSQAVVLQLNYLGHGGICISEMATYKPDSLMVGGIFNHRRGIRTTCLDLKTNEIGFKIVARSSIVINPQRYT